MPYQFSMMALQIELLKFVRLSEASLTILCEWFNSSEAAGKFDANISMTLETAQKRFYQGHFESIRIVEYDGKPIGWVDVHIRSEFPTSAGLTVQISKPDCRGQGLGFAIHQMALAEFLDENKTVRWIEAWTHVGNLAEQKILEKLSFKRDFETLKQFPINGNDENFYIYELEIKTR
jgi:RimJ/RimL family protein N-acetyltransferase